MAVFRVDKRQGYMASLRRYAAMFRVGTSFIFSNINARSSSVTQNLICTVRFSPMRSRSFLLRVWDTSQQAISSRRAAGREGENTEKVHFFYACYGTFLPLTDYSTAGAHFAKGREKNGRFRPLSVRYFFSISSCKSRLTWV